jgi:hypothetical protein
MKRYKNCNRVVKCYRWLKYKPLAALKAVVAVTYWICTGARVPEFMRDQNETLSFIWRCHLSVADMDMNNYVTLQEAITELKDKINGSKQVENAD